MDDLVGMLPLPEPVEDVARELAEEVEGTVEPVADAVEEAAEPLVEEVEGVLEDDATPAAAPGDDEEGAAGDDALGLVSTVEDVSGGLVEGVL